MTPETLATAVLVAAVPATGFGVLALITAPDPQRAVVGALGIGAISWLVLGLYLTLVFST